MTTSSPARSCPTCGESDPVDDTQPVWPLGWQCPSCSSIVASKQDIPLFAPALADTVTGFDPASFARLAAVEATNFWFVPRNRLLTGLIAKYFPDAKRFLEIGCGNAAVLSAVAKRGGWERIAGSELHPTGLGFARPRLPPEVELVQMDARNIPAIGLFDLIGAFDVIEHIAEDEAVLRAMRRALVPGGGVIIAVPQHPSLWSQADEIAHHERRYERGELEAKLARNGFRTVFSTSYTTLLLPLMMLNRRKARTQADRDEIMRETELPRAVNTVLTAVLQAEVTMTLAGLKWPVGGSRIVVARAT